MRVLVAIALVACGSGDKPAAPKRTGSSVEMIDQPIVVDGGRPAEGGSEAEPNDHHDNASKLAPGATVRGRIDQDGDVDHYALEVTAAGVLALEVTAIDGFDLAVELEDATGATVAKSDRGAVKTREGLPNFPVAVGRYTAVVKANKPPPPKLKKGQKPPVVAPAGPSPVYEITATVAPPAAGFEREPDDDRGAANELILGDPVQGYLGWTGDADAWKLSLEALSSKNAIDIEVTTPESVAITLDVADGIGAPLATRKGPKGAALVIRGLVPVIAPGAAPFHYLTLKGDRSNPETAYRIVVKEHAVGPDAEVEPDDTIEKAMPMPADRTLVRGTWSTGDVDCYVLETLDNERDLTVEVDTPTEADLFVELLVDGKQLAKSDVKGKGTAERIATKVPPRGRPVIRVRASDPNATGEGEYKLTVIEATEPAAPPP